IPAFNLFENGMKIKHLFTAFGGHSQAAGMTFLFENLSLVKEKLNEAISTQLNEEDFKQVISVSQTIKLEDISEKFVYNIQKFTPFGIGNKEPVFHFKSKPSQIRQIGQDKSHLKMQFNKENFRLEAIGF